MSRESLPEATKESLTTTKVSVPDPAKVSVKEEAPQAAPKKRRGRPPKKEVEAKKRGNRGVMGRPKGDAAIMNEYKARMLSSPKSAKVLEAIFEAALNDDHKNQAAAWKIVVDRMMPVSMFEKDVVKGGGRNAITVNITGVGSTSIQNEDDIIEAEFDEN